jgi:hypothetical protein
MKIGTLVKGVKVGPRIFFWGQYSSWWLQNGTPKKKLYTSGLRVTEKTYNAETLQGTSHH